MIYIHVPFCQRFCTYCDFYSEIHSEQKAALWGDAVCAEIRRRSAEIDDRVKTLYFGGGTPSVLPLSILSKILIALDETGHGGPYTEFTLEANPDDICARGVGYVRSLLALGMNRLSIGVQSFDDTLLGWMNRRHDAEGAREAIRIARKAGVQNLSIDLIFGLANLSDEVWEATIREALAQQVEHISCYQLTIEGESVLAGMLADGRYTQADEDQCRRQYETLCRLLGEAGYHHYEISNFAKPGYRSRHNSSYWHDVPYIGLGAAAHSYDGTCRSWNVADIRQYISATERGERPAEYETLDDDTRYNDRITVALRTSDGLDLTTLSEKHRRYCLKEAERYISDGLLRIEGNRLMLTRKGLFVSDMVMSSLVYV